MDKIFLDYFWQLASLDADERQNGAKDLITYLHNSYQNFIKSEEKLSENNNIEINDTGYLLILIQ